MSVLFSLHASINSEKNKIYEACNAGTGSVINSCTRNNMSHGFNIVEVMSRIYYFRFDLTIWSLLSIAGYITSLGNQSLDAKFTLNN